MVALAGASEDVRTFIEHNNDGGSSFFIFCRRVLQQCNVRFFLFYQATSKAKSLKKKIGILLGIIAAFVPPSVSSAAGRPDVRVVQSSEQSIRIEVTPKYFQPGKLRFKDKEFDDYDFEGSAAIAKLQDVGVPDLKYKVLPLGFKSKEGNFVQVVAADYEDIPNVLLKPTPTLHIVDQMLVVKEFSINNERYSQNRFLPTTLAELSPVERSRSMLVGGVKVYPIQYNPVTRTLRKYTRIVLEVTFGNSSLTRIRNDDDQLLAGLLLNMNEAKSWKFGDPRPLNSVAERAPSVLASGNWYRLTVADEGMYILDAAWFSSNGINMSGVDPRKIRIYGNGGEELPEAVTSPRPVDLVENAIYVEGEGDGQFNTGDYVLFYGKGVQGIKYDPVGKTLRHYIHHYSRINYYWLTIGSVNGKRMEMQQSVASTPTIIPTKFMDAAWIEPDTVNLLKSGKNWLSFPITPNGSQVRTFTLNGLIASEPRQYRYTLVSASSNGATFNVHETGTVIGSHYLYPAGGYSVAVEGTFGAAGNFPLQNNTSQLRFEFVSSEPGASGWLDWAEVIYQRTFDPVNNSLRFRSPDTTGVVEYRLGQFSGTSSVFNVTSYADVKRVAATAGTFRASEVRGQVSEYFGLTSSVYKTPIGFAKIDNQNLRGINQAYDFIIITSSEISSAAKRLRDHRSTPTWYGGMTPIVVDVNQIYNEFSCGVPDVSAIRDFLKYAYDNWSTPPQSPPKFVCFFGQGSYDYKGITGSKTSYVPTWEGRTEYDDVGSSATDDFFVRFVDSTRPWMVAGRLNARSAREAEQLVDKLIAYDTQSIRDQWKLRAVYVGDDGWTPDFDEGSEHTRGAEGVATRTPEIFEKRKIYLEEYPTLQTAQGRRKPAAYQDIIDDLNRGALLVSFTGHGNPTVWTHEAVFTTQSSIPQLVNKNKLFVFFGATCNFSQFDDLNRPSGGELLMARTEGGAIGVISASRKVYSAQNQRLNFRIFELMFPPTGSRISVERVATALYQYKLEINDDNDEKYFWLGDPTMRLQYPRSYASIDTINREPVDSINGVPRLSPIQMKALQRVTLKGTIRNEANQVQTAFNGRSTLTVNDGNRQINIPSFGSFTYTAPGGLLYRGENSVSNGTFTASFVVPKDIAYGDSTARGRLVSYFSTDTLDGAGYTSKIWIGGTDANAGNDTEGPAIKILLGNTYESSLSFRPGSVVNEKPVLYVDLVDSNGVNTSTSGVGHRIEAWINNSPQSIDMTEFYTSKLNNFQAGTVTYPLRDLPQGNNTIKVRAWDTYNNSHTAETNFEVLSSDQLRVVDVMNFPNPFRSGTAFTFRHNQALPVNATVKIYTVAGRLIQTLDTYSATDTFVSIPWNGRDRDGDQLANGVYLYKVMVRTVDGRFNSEVMGKLAVAK